MREFFIKEIIVDEKNKYKVIARHNDIVSKLCVKTSALWLASELIQKHIFTNRSVDEIYEALKSKGKKKVLSEKPNLSKYLK